MSSLQLDKPALKTGLTQKQIADQLGVSRQLVGFALRGQGRMSDEVRRQILETAQLHGYHVGSNREARSMVSRRYGKRVATGVLAVLFEATFEDQPLSHVPFFMPFFEGLETEAIRHHVDLALCALRPGTLPRLVADNQVDGVICLLTPADVAHSIAQLDLPLVNILSDIEGFPSLRIDHEGGGVLAARHLLDLGHRRIAYLGVSNESGAKRQSGFRRALQEAGALDETLFVAADASPSIRTGALLMRELLGKTQRGDFSAIACFNDLLAIGAVAELRQAGLDVPDNISVVGFDDVSLAYDFSPALTSIGFSRQEIGKRAVQLLCSPEGVSPTAAFPVQLVQRDSTRPFVFQGTP